MNREHLVFLVSLVASQMLVLALAQWRDERAFARQKRLDDEQEAKRAAWLDGVKRHRQWSDGHLAELRADYFRETGQQLPIDERAKSN